VQKSSKTQQVISPRTPKTSEAVASRYGVLNAQVTQIQKTSNPCSTASNYHIVISLTDASTTKHLITTFSGQGASTSEPREFSEIKGMTSPHDKRYSRYWNCQPYSK